MKDLKGKVAVITGAANGFGMEYVKEAAKRGMKIVAVDIEGDEVLACEQVAKDLGAEDIVCMQADVSLESDTDKIIQTTMEKYGAIDLLINNAGIGSGGSITSLPLKDWEWMVYTNVMSHIYLMKRAIPIMMKQGTHCNILNVCSLAGLITSNAMPAYYSTKHAAVTLSRAIQYELESIGADIQISIFCPGFVQTDLHHAERHKPARFADWDDPYYKSETYQYALKASEYVVTNGRPIDGFGETCFKAIEDDQFYIVTHEEYDPIIKKQIYDRVNMVNPDLSLLGRERKYPNPDSDRDLTGRVALITGAAYGFGKEFVKEAAKRKMKIVACDIMEDELMKLEDVAKEYGAEDITLVHADVSLYEETEKVVKAAMDNYGQIDLLINNAGITVPGSGLMAPIEDWEWIFRVNYFAHIYFMRQVVPIMLKQGTHCNIMNVASCAGLLTSSGMPTYYTTKNAAVALAECVEYEMQQLGADIHVGVFCPGFVQTNLDHSEEYRPERFKKHLDNPYYQSEAFAKGQQAAQFVIKTGRPLEGFGARVFENIESDTFYCVTHEEYNPYILKEVDDMLERKNPECVGIMDIIKDIVKMPGK